VRHAQGRANFIWRRFASGILKELTHHLQRSSSAPATFSDRESIQTQTRDFSTDAINHSFVAGFRWVMLIGS
jgi:hypothetical protein